MTRCPPNWGKVTGNLNIITDYDVDGAGNVTKLTDPEGNITTYTVNDLNQTIITVEPLSVTRNTYYDANDRVTKTTVTNDTVNGDTLYTVLKEYDPIGNMTKLIEDVTSTGTLTTTYVYDDNDRLTKQTTPEGVETRFTYDERGLLLTRTLELGTTDANTSNTYDLNGNRTKVTDALGNETTFAFDALDRLTKTTSDIGNVTDRFYDDAGNVTKVSSFDNAGTPNKLAETTTSYDEANRVYKTERMAKKADLSVGCRKTPSGLTR